MLGTDRPSGRGRLPSNYENLGFQQAAFVQPNESEYFMRPQGANGLDAAAFHYSVYRSLTRFLGMDGNLEVAYDVPRNWQTMWNVLFTSSAPVVPSFPSHAAHRTADDFLNANTGRVDPRHLWGAAPSSFPLEAPSDGRRLQARPTRTFFGGLRS